MQGSSFDEGFSETTEVRRNFAFQLLLAADLWFLTRLLARHDRLDYHAFLLAQLYPFQTSRGQEGAMPHRGFSDGSGVLSGAMRSVYSGLLSFCVVPGVIAVWFTLGAILLRAQSATEYQFSFPDALHHVMQVEVTFHNVPSGPLRVQVSRSSAGRYAAFEFAENVFDEKITDGNGMLLTATRPNPRTWEITRHGSTVRISYHVFGNRVDGTFLAVDSTHAHINFPAAVMWAHGFANRPVRVTFVLPVGSDWKVATQLYPTSDLLTFTAPNLQYLMDSPAEVSHFSLRTFRIPALGAGGKTQTLRVVAHHQGTDTDMDAYVANVQKIVREEQAIFDELPDFEPGYYTFLLDYLPWDNGDGMEHRNSTVITSGRFALSQKRALQTAAHEFFHCWNVKRIRPATLEPFNFADVNMSGELWLAEGFTSYYGRLILLRSGLTELTDGLSQLAGEIGYVTNAPGTRFRSAVEMSRLAPFVDGISNAFPTYGENTFVSYYSFGDIIALDLDLTLRARSDSRVTLDDFMRAMWRIHGKPGGAAPGLVSHPYTMADVRARLAEVSGDKVFADDFVRRYIEGTEKVDLAPLLLRAGFILRKKSDAPTLGTVLLQKKDDGLQVANSTPSDSPAYFAGLDLDDQLISVAGVTLTSPEDLPKALAGHSPGDKVELVFKRRGQAVSTSATLAEDPQLELVPVEATGGTLSQQQKQFREAWLHGKASNQ
jgi:predicted metalloprotease with PDZ domain